MSRICVKNLPPKFTEDQLRNHFSKKGEVTDAKIIRTTDGRSRQFGFVGYRTEEEANNAVKYFQNTYLNTLKISCEVAYRVGAKDVPRPWSQYSQQKAKEKENKNEKAKEKENKNEKDQSTLSKIEKKLTAKGDAKSLSSDKDKDPMFEEFLQVMQPRSKAKVWANDTLLGPDTGHTNKVRQVQGKGKKEKKNVDVEMVDGGLQKEPVGEGKVSKKMQQVQDSIEDESDGDSEEVLSETEDFVIEEPADYSGGHEGSKKVDIAKDDTVSDMEYFKSRIKSSLDKEDSDDDEMSDEADDDSDNGISEDLEEEISKEDAENGGSSIEEQNENPESHASYEKKEETGHTSHDMQVENSNSQMVGHENLHEDDSTNPKRIFVRNLPFTTSEEDLADFFSSCGEISEVHVVLDKMTRRSKGFAYVLYLLPESAQRAIAELDSSIFQGRLLHVMPAKQLPSAPERQQSVGKIEGMNTFKLKREDQKKAAEASGDTRAWNSLFMHPDTIAENIARKFKISKSELLNPEAEDLAVRMALGETHVIAETKKALSEEGINVELLEDLASGKLEKAKRSNRIILIKNLPFSTVESELFQMFGKFGSLERLIIPPTKTMALAVYLEAAEARAAFRGLAYKRYKHIPLYLEWAPDNVLSSRPIATNRLAAAKSTGIVSAKRVAVDELVSAFDNVDSDSEETSTSVFVKNLNFKTTEEALRKHFTEHMKEGILRSITMKRGDKPGRENKGFCFLEFDTCETAKLVCKNLQGTVIDGHSLVLQISQIKSSNNEKRLDKKKSLTKIIVKNLAFEATKKDLRQLFSPFGQIKTLRIPKKADRTHRGFAFVEFVTKQEAENAYKALSSSHLYGRHLVLEQAQEGETLSELRARVASKFTDDNEITNNENQPKRRKIMESAN